MQNHLILSAAFAAALCFNPLIALAETPPQEGAATEATPEATPETPAEAAPANPRYSGTVVSVDEVAKSLTVKLEDGQEIVLAITAETRFRGDDPALDLSKIKSGEAVRGMFAEVDGVKQAISVRTGSKVAPPKKPKAEAEMAE